MEHGNLYDQFDKKPCIEKGKWSLNTAIKCKNPLFVPKFQQYETYNFHQPKSEDVKKWQVATMATDNITLKFDENNKKGPDEPRSYDIKNKFGSHTETYNQGWVPNDTEKTINNRSSVPYNILNMAPNPLSGSIAQGVLDKKLFNVKKGVAEISDLTRVTYPNFNANYAKLYHENNNIFKSVKGIFTDMYDASLKNGSISLPFRRGADVGEEGSQKSKIKNSPRSFKKHSSSIDFGTMPKTTKKSNMAIQLDPIPTGSINFMPGTTRPLIMD